MNIVPCAVFREGRKKTQLEACEFVNAAPRPDLPLPCAFPASWGRAGHMLGAFFFLRRAEQHAGTSLTRDQTRAPCIGSA